MNNTKWLKLFRALCSSDLISICLVKNVGDNHLREIELPSINNFSDSFNAEGVNDVSYSGPYEFKSIEFIEFPVGYQKRNQDIVKIKALIDQIGMFEIELTETELRVYGYR